MANPFDNNSYYFVANRESWHDFKEEAEKSLKYEYAAVAYDKFSHKFESSKGKDHWKASLKQAFPGAMWATAQMITHLAKLIFIGIPQAILREKQYLEVHCFYLARDFQELAGKIISIFFDRYGTYLIEKSQFHKKCYDYFLINYFNKKDDQTFKSLAENNFKNGQLDQALIDCEKIKDQQGKRMFLLHLLCGYIDKGQKLECLSIIEKLPLSNVILNAVIKRAIENKNYDLAVAIIEKIKDPYGSDLYLEQIFTGCLEKGQFHQAFLIIDKFHNISKMDLLNRIGKECVISLNAILNSKDKLNKNRLLNELGHECIKIGNLTLVYNIAIQIDDDEIKKNLLTELSNKDNWKDEA